MDKESQDIDFEIKFYEGIIQKKPDFIEALMALGDLYTKRGLFKEGLRVDEKLVQLRPEDATVLYNLACSYSLLNDLDKALRNIKRSFDCGYTDLLHLEQDRDLVNLRNDERFKEYFAKLKTKRLIKSKQQK